MFKVREPVTAGNPPRKLASMFRPASGHFSVQNFASSDASIGAVTVNTKRDGTDAPLLTSIEQDIEFLTRNFFAIYARQLHVHRL